MRLNIMIEGQDGVDWPQWVSIARATEAAGLEGLFRSDHYLAIRRTGPVGGLDAWATLAALAAVTTRIRLGTLVSPVTFRAAAVLARSATTVDLISQGRVDVGVGAGWYEAEHLLYDFPFPPLVERVAELEGQLELLDRHWSEKETEIWPKPVQRPRPHVIVGGLAGPRTVRAAVRFADEYNTYFPTVEQVRERRRIVDEAASAARSPRLTFSAMLSCVVGNDRAEVHERLAVHGAIAKDDDPPPIAGTVEEVVEQLRPYRDAGVERLMVQHLAHEDTDMIRRLGEVATELEED